jgi:hypothetical protein
MPRLVGKPSKAPSYIGLALLVTILGAGALEYSGTIDLVPGFGQGRVAGNPRLPIER